jgi:hypothetical protein
VFAGKYIKRVRIVSSMSYVMLPQLRSGCHMRSMCPRHVIDPRKASSGESDDDNVDYTRIGGPTQGIKLTQKLIDTEDVPKGP